MAGGGVRPILVLTQKVDPHADHVVTRMTGRGLPVIRFDTAEFPLHAVLNARYSGRELFASLSTADHRLALEDVRSVWYRRPTRFQFHPAMPAEERQFAHQEALMAIGGLFRCAECLWVNHPDNLASAQYKPYQLHLAVECGLDVPRTVITNDPTVVQEFFEECGGRVCYKTLSRAGVADSRSGNTVIYTTLVELSSAEDFRQVRNTACLFQEYLDKQVELRINVLGDEIFAGEIHSQGAAESSVDFRRGYKSLTYGVHRLPAATADACVRLTKRLGLVSAAIDMVLTPGGEYFFLELNPNGQWLWIEHMTGAPLTDALIDLLALKDSVSGGRGLG
jgi:ATP-grasp ribosomal peptide maturase